MKSRLLYFVLIFYVNSHSQNINGVENFILASQEDQEILVQQYFDPLFNVLQVSMGEGWVKSAKTHKKLGFDFIDADYDKDNWFQRVKGLENEPERGKRCTVCFDMRFERSALYAHENNFNYFATTLGISRWKDMNQINDSGKQAAERYEDVSYWDFNWRKDGGSSRMIEISKREKFYQQEYCGCVYSLRDTNRWRRENNRDRIIRGVKFYS